MERRQTEGRRHRLSGVPTGRLDIERRLRDMDATSVDVHVLSATPTTYLYDQDASPFAVTSAIQNDKIAKHIAAHPGRFMGIATLPMQAPQRAADEFAGAMTKLRPARFHDCVQCRRQKSRRSGS